MIFRFRVFDTRSGGADGHRNTGITVWFTPLAALSLTVVLSQSTVWSIRLYTLPCSRNGRVGYVQLACGVVVTLAGGNPPSASWAACRAIPSCFMLFVHLARLAASRTFWTAGSKRPIRI